MNKQNAQDLAKSIVAAGRISDANAQKLMKVLKPRELSQFLRVLKQEYKKQVLVVTSAEDLSAETVKNLKSLFKTQNVVKEVDAKIGAGIVIRDYDMIYDLSIKSEINRLVEHVQEEL